MLEEKNSSLKYFIFLKYFKCVFFFSRGGNRYVRNEYPRDCLHYCAGGEKISSVMRIMNNYSSHVCTAGQTEMSPTDARGR